jgi:hypothetical protein
MTDYKSILSPDKILYAQDDIFEASYSKIESLLVFERLDAAKAVAHFYYEITEDDKGFKKIRSMIEEFNRLRKPTS